jgi:monoamine oxidase
MVEMHNAASGEAALFCFLVVSAEQRVTLGEEALTRACLNQFARILGAGARSPSTTLFQDWAADPRTAAAAHRGVGGLLAPDPAPWVTGPWRKCVALAGSATSPSEPGYLAGAVVAVTRSVDETLRKLGAGGRRAGNVEL